MEEREITGVCCICKGPVFGWGNNPDGAMWLNEEGEVESADFGPDDRCCDDCNCRYVIPGRIYRMKHHKPAETK